MNTKTKYFNNFFVNIVPNLGIEIDQQHLNIVSNISDPVEKAIKKYQKHPSISIINKMVSSFENEASFSFTCVTVDDISKEINRLDIKKATQEGDIPTKKNLTIDQLAFCLICLKHMKDSYMTKCILMGSSISTYAKFSKKLAFLTT